MAREVELAHMADLAAIEPRIEDSRQEWYEAQDPNKRAAALDLAMDLEEEKRRLFAKKRYNLWQ